MLEELELRDLGPIRNATIDPAEGMTAITGETGAGKSMLLSALRMISGAPAEPARVAPDAERAWAQGVFLAGDDVRGLLEQAGVDADDQEVFLSRTVPAHGRSRAVACGRTVPRSLLAQLCERLVTIHGQADQLRIASPARQREFLDRHAGDEALLDEYARAWNAWREVDERLTRLESQQASMRQQADYLRESIARIDEVDPHAGELEDLKSRRARIENAARVSSGVATALAALDGAGDGDGYTGAADLVQRAADVLRALSFDERFAQCADRLVSAHAEIEDVAFSLSGLLDAEEGEADLDAINGRIHELDELVRRWGPGLEDVIAWRERARFDVEDLDDSPERLEQLRARRERLRGDLTEVARRLSRARTHAAERLCAAVDGELTQLAMAGASLRIAVTPRRGEDALDATGGDDVEFLFTPFPGSEALPMGRSASGGELSRLMLALELSAAHGARNMTFIFDEVDAGVGGKAAVELGRRLARLARHAQVIVVTHLPQVASWAQRQYVVSKEEDEDGATRTQVLEVDGEARVEEIARMLAGSESRTSRDHARELLSSCTLEGTDA